ncbi:MAG: GNAT family N-acetyltransferase [Actinobacteria bacterium]|nr:GNAT family N-acetyltransferase [Actinomycetota bacterium]
MIKIKIKILADFDNKLIELIKNLEKENLGELAALNEWQIPVIIRYGKFVAAVTEDTGEIAGICEMLKEWKHEKTAFIHSFYVAEKFRHGGIGSQLLGSVINILKNENFNAVELTVNPGNRTAVNLYNNAGFTAKEMRHDEYGKGIDRILMVLKLV